MPPGKEYTEAELQAKAEKQRQYARDYYHRNKEKIREEQKKYYQDHSEEIRERQRIIHHIDKPEIVLSPEDQKKKKKRKEYNRKYRERHKEKCDEISRKWRNEHKDEYNARLRGIRRENGIGPKVAAPISSTSANQHEKRIAYQRQYYQEHKAEIAEKRKQKRYAESPDTKAYQRKYYQDHKTDIAEKRKQNSFEPANQNAEAPAEEPSKPSRVPVPHYCIRCGTEYAGLAGSYLCPACALESKRNAVILPRTCRSCGATFQGGPRAQYCPECRADRRKKTDAEFQARAKAGAHRPLGSTDLCVVCGKPYIVNGGRQKYCPECAPAAIAAADRKAGLQTYVQNKETYNAKRTAARKSRIRYCAVCGKEIPATSPRTICDSPECAETRRKEWSKRCEAARSPRPPRPQKNK